MDEQTSTEVTTEETKATPSVAEEPKPEPKPDAEDTTDSMPSDPEQLRKIIKDVFPAHAGMSQLTLS